MLKTKATTQATSDLSS